MVPNHLLQFHEKEIQVLDQGAIRLVDLMGDDMTIVNAARISYAPVTKRLPKADRKLLRYLMRHAHTSPMEMCEIVFYIRAPLHVVQQWLRHRTASLNQSSHRYSVALDSMQATTPDKWRAQATDNKQGSNGFVTDGEYLSTREQELQTLAREVYEERLAKGVAKEQARKDLPHSTYTELVWKMDAHNLLHFLRLRLDPTAQQEIRAYADAIAEIVRQWLPWTWEAFEDYTLHSVKLSRMEAECLKEVLNTIPDIQNILAQSAPKFLEDRELNEFTAKVQKLLS